MNNPNDSLGLMWSTTTLPTTAPHTSDDALVKTVVQPNFLRVGECIVDLQHHEIRAPNSDAPTRIKLKTLQVLTALASYPGRAVSREALLELVWPNTMPTQDVITQAIAQLRKAFGDHHDCPRYLETINKGGYRLIAPVAWTQADPFVSIEPAYQASPSPALMSLPPSTALPASSRNNILIACVLLAGVVLLISLIVMSMWPLRGSPVTGTQRMSAPATYQRITSLPGNENYPSVSPDGSQVVYSAYAPDDSRAALIIQATAPVPGRTIAHAPMGIQYTMPSWSPDGRLIAFVAIGPGEQCDIQVMPASGGSARRISACRQRRGSGISWHPDGRHLITTLRGADSPDDGAIHTVDVINGQWTRLPYQKSANDVDLSPVYSPDGRWIAFHRNISGSDLWRVAAAGGIPQRLTNLQTNILSLAWDPRGDSIIFGRYMDGTISTSLARLDLHSLQVTDLGIPNSAFPSIATNSPSLAFALDQSRSAIFSVHLAQALAPSNVPTTPIFPSSGNDLLPSIAPDGRQIVFISDRSARLGIWWARLGVSDSLRLLEGLVPVPRYPVAWSQDSTRMLVVGRADADPANAAAGLFELIPDTGHIQRLPLPAGAPVYAEYVPGSSQLLVVADQGAGRLRATLYERSTTPWNVITSLDDVRWAHLDSTRQRIFFTRLSKPGLWQSDMQLQGARLFSSRLDTTDARRWVVAKAHIWAAKTNASCGLLQIVVTVHGESNNCLQAERLGLTSLSWDAVHNDLYFAADSGGGSDIAWMQLPATQRTHSENQTER